MLQKRSNVKKMTHNRFFLQAKEWLCLNCQTQRALKGIEPPGQPTVNPSKSQKMESTLGLLEKQPITLPTKASHANQPVAQKKEMHEQQTSAEGAKQAPSPKLLPQPTAKNAPSSPMSKAAPKAETEQEQSGFFSLGFGGARSRSPSPQPAVSAMSGKVLGFGSSFLSSASSLISSSSSSADEPSMTPPTNPQASSVSQTSPKTTTPPTSLKGSTTSQGAAISEKGKANESVHKEEKKTEPTADQNNKAPISKKSEPSSQMPKTVKGPQPPPKFCPLCKVEIKKDLVNYSTCTECKNTVCNLCGFNPTPHQTEVSICCLLIPLKSFGMLHVYMS